MILIGIFLPICDTFDFLWGIWVYTRYADDLCLSASAPDCLHEMPLVVKSVLRETGWVNLKLNDKKTVHLSKKSKRIVTGLIITNDGLISIGREKKRRISAMLHRFSLGKLNEDEISRLHGMLALLNAIEREFLEKLKKKYGSGTIQKLKAAAHLARGPLDDS